jgi:predicted NBD/HSP70 family sugar kinase
MRPGAAFVLGIDLGGTKLHIALSDLSGQVVAEAVEPTAPEGGIHVVQQIGRIADQLIESAGIERQRLLGGVMGSPGVVDPVSGAIAIAPNIPAFDSFDVQGALRDRLDVEVAIENDVNLAAVGEHWRGNSRNARTFAFIAMGTGIGMGLFADGRLVRGARGAAGEIAYLPLGGDPYDARGLRLGTLETAICSAAITDRYAGHGGTPGRTVRQIFDCLGEDEAAQRTIDEVARIIAIAILAVQSVIDPEVVVLGGSIGVRPELGKKVVDQLARCMRDPVPVEVSALGSRATLIGAIGSAIDMVHRKVFGIGGESGSMSP